MTKESKKPAKLQDIQIKNEIIQKASFSDGWTTHFEGLSQQDFSATGEDNRTKVFFRNIEQKVLSYIKEYPIVVGCVAWFTNENILKALAKKEGVSILVQKEDFLRPDITTNKNWALKLRAL